MAYLEEEQVVGMAENEQLAAAIAMSLQQVASETETPSMPHMHGDWPHYINDEDKHLYYYYPWGRWFINSGFTPMERRRGGEIKTDGVLVRFLLIFTVLRLFYDCFATDLSLLCTARRARRLCVEGVVGEAVEQNHCISHSNALAGRAGGTQTPAGCRDRAASYGDRVAANRRPESGARYA